MEHKFKVGDRVRFNGAGDNCYVRGEIGVIQGETRSSLHEWIVKLDSPHDYGHKCGGATADHFGRYARSADLEPAPYKVGDRITPNRDIADYFTVGKVYEIARENSSGGFMLTDNRRDPNRPHHTDCKWLAENFTVVPAPKFKLGDRVRIVKHVNYRGGSIPMDLPIGSVHTITDQFKSGEVAGWLLSGKGRNFYGDNCLEAAPLEALKIEAGKFYRTRDGRKVGPMERTSNGRAWTPNSGRHYYDDDGKRSWGGDDGTVIVAEWTEPPPKPATVIVALIESGQPKPATRPYVHTSVEAATVEAERLANKLRGSQFGVFAMVAERKIEKPVYPHKWQNEAADGLKIDAIRELRSVTGLGLATAKRAVEDWLERQAA